MLSLNNLSKIKEEIKNKRTGIIYALKTFSFLIILVLTMILGVVVILILSGTFSASLNQTENY